MTASTKTENPPPLHVVEVSGNLKGGTSAKLGLRTLLLGPNASRKTAYIQTIQAALTDTVSDVRGRDDVKDARTFSTLCPPEETGWARAVLSDGRMRQCTIAWDSIGGKHKKPEGSDPGIRNIARFPYAEVAEIVLGEPDRARKALLSIAADTVTAADVLAVLSPEHRTLYEACARGGEGSAVGDLQNVITLADERVRRKRTEARALTAGIDARTAGLRPLPTAAELASARETYESAVAAARAIGIPQPHPNLDWFRADAERATTAAMAAKSALLMLEAEQTEANAQLSAFGDYSTAMAKYARLEALANVLAWHIASPSECRVCGGAPPDGGRLQGTQAIVGELVEKLAQAPRLLNRYRKLNGDVQVARSSFETLKATALRAIEVYETAQERAASMPAPQAAPDTEGPRRVYEDLVRIQNMHLSLVQDRATRDALEQDAERFATFHKACKEALASLVQSTMRVFKERVQKYLDYRPNGDTFGVFEEGNALMLGFERDGRVDIALSGSEYLRLLLALALARVEAERAGGPILAVVIPEERAFDAVTLRNVMDTLAWLDLPAQVILQSPTIPLGVDVHGGTKVDADAVHGWTIVQTGPIEPPWVVRVELPSDEAAAVEPAESPLGDVSLEA